MGVTNEGFLAAVEREGEALAVAAERAGLGAPVPSCPDWRVADLVYHAGEVVHFWGSVVAERRTEEPEDAPPERPADADLLAWYRGQLASAAAALAAADPATPVWSWSPHGGSAGWVVRRMAQELAVHRWDGERAASEDPPPIDAELASDGIDEYLDHFASWPYRDAVDLDGTVHLHCTDVEGEWLVRQPEPGAGLTFTREHAKGDVAVRGPASDLLLALWKRRPLDGLDTFGDADVARRLIDRTDLN